jgi:uncharacterized protein DUF5658
MRSPAGGSSWLFAALAGTPVALEPAVRIPRSIAVLVALNVALQVFDGVATYLGWTRFGEGNPFLRAGFETWGAGPTLLLAKLLSVALVLSVARVPRRTLVGLALTLTLGVYATLSCLPWCFCLLTPDPTATLAGCPLP